MQDLNFKSLMRVTVFLVFTIALGHLMIIGKQIIIPLLISFFLAFLLLPMVRQLEKWRFPTPLAAITALLSITMIIGGILTLFGTQIRRFGRDIDNISERLLSLRSSLPGPLQESMSDWSSDDLYVLVEENMGSIFQGISGFVSSFTFLVIIPVYIILILIYRDVFRNFIIRVMENASPAPDATPSDKKSIREIIPSISGIIQSYIVGMFYVICILFVLNSIALNALGIEHALLFAAFAAMLNIIPFVGPLVGSLLPALYSLVTMDSLFYPFAVVMAFVVIQTAESYLITPNIVGRNLKLNPMVTLLTLFLGASLWGVIGMIVFIPLVAILKEILANIHGLEPYAYVLGTGEKDKLNQAPGWLSRLSEKVSEWWKKRSA